MREEVSRLVEDMDRALLILLEQEEGSLGREFWSRVVEWQREKLGNLVGEETE